MTLQTSLAAAPEALAETFLGHILSGELDAACAMVAPEARFVGARPEPSESNPLFGTHIGPEGARAFFSVFGTVFTLGVFEVQGGFGSGRRACHFGRLCHKVTATGRDFASDWALVTEWSDAGLTLYHFYEDTAALEEARRPV